MAEYVSAIFGLVQFSLTVCGTVYEVVDNLKDAQEDLNALRNEITDFRLILDAVVEAHDAGQLSNSSARKRAHMDLINRCNKTLEAVSALMIKVKKDQDNGDAKVRKLKWLQHTNKCRKLKDALRVLSSSLNNLIVAKTSVAADGIGVRLEQLTIETKSVSAGQQFLAENQQIISQRLLDHHNRMQHYVSQELQHLEERSRRRDEHLEQMFGTLMSSAASTIGTRIPKRVGDGNTVDPRDSSLRARGYIQTLPMSFNVSRTGKGLECLEACPCRCHSRRSFFRSPRTLSTYVGDIFVGGSGLPWCFSSLAECDEQTCRRSKGFNAQISYYLPPFISKVTRFSMNIGLHAIPLNVSVQTRTTIAYDSPIFICVQEGNIDGIKDLLLSGRASLRDVDPYGLGLLYYATYYCWRSSGTTVALETCKTLLDAGADPDWEDEIGNTPVDTIIDDLLISWVINDPVDAFDPNQLHNIARIFGKHSFELFDDYREERKFTPIHDVLLGIDCSKGSLESFLSSFDAGELANVIDTADTRGRTPLAWAVEYGWAPAVAVLLRFGADPHQARPSLRGRMPLLHLVIAGPSADQPAGGFLDVIKTLLQAGVDINARDHEGWTPLHVAASWSRLDVIELLAQFGEDELNWDAVTTDGQTALDLARQGGRDEEVMEILVERRTRRIDKMEKSGGTGLSCSEYGRDCNVGDEDDLDDAEFHDALDVLVC